MNSGEPMGSGGGILSRLGERVLGWIALGLLVLLGVAIWRMDAATRLAIWNGIWRTIVWVAIAALLPWVSKLIVRRVLATGTNWAGVVLLAGLTLVDVLAGVILLGGLPHGAWGWAAGLAAVAIAGSYNYLVAEYVAEQAGG